MEQLIITDNTKNCAYAVYAVMFATTFFVYLAGWILKKDMLNFKLRLKSFWLIVILFTVAFSFNKLFAFFFLALINYLALKEFFSLIPTRRADRRVLLWAYLVIPVQFYFIYINWIVMFYLLVPLYMFLFIPMRMVLIGENEGFLKSCGTIHWGLMSTVYSLGYLAAYMSIPVEKNPTGGAVGMLLCILILTVFNDFAQFLFGKSFGKHKIIPKVSPNKTWEGFIGGVIATTLMALFLVPYLTPLSLIRGGGAGFVIAVAGYLGDVTMSAIKRDIGVKDTGSLLPGHGGILDRLDSLVFTAPLFFHYIVYLNKIDLYIPFN
ncbi:MAG: phosphatidate cytidylyltransferase [Thermoguttaceae bacterium]